MWPTELGIGIAFLLSLFGTVIVCARMNDPAPLDEEEAAPVLGDQSPAEVPTR